MPTTRFQSAVASTLAVSLASAACGSAARPVAQAPEYQPENQTKCSVRASNDRPLIVEWPSADRAALEALAKRSLVVVRYGGCEMELLPRCQLAGGYRYTPTTRKLEQVVIRDADELYAQLPVGAAALEGKLEQTGQLNVALHVVGRYDAVEAEEAEGLEGACDGATHVVTGLTAGAFEFRAGAGAELGGGASVLGAGVGAKSSSEQELINRDGNPERCAAGSSSDEQPPEGCGALLRVEVSPVESLAVAGREPAALPSAAAESSAPVGPLVPPGDGVVRVHIQSPDAQTELRGDGVSKLVSAPGGYRSVGASTILCRAPCGEVVDARVGQYLSIDGPDMPASRPFQLYDQQGDVKLDVTPGNSTYLAFAGVGYGVGVLATITGLSLLLTGALISSGDSSTGDETGSDITKWGLITTGGGLVFLGAGIAFDYAGSTDVEITPGPPR